MRATTEKLRHAKQFAEETGVTVRTLHVYDRLGLLPPAARTQSGYRLYGEAELERLEQILALRFVGFKLEHIKELLQGTKWPLVAALRLQREAIAQQKRKLEAAMAAIESAEAALAADGTSDRWNVLRTVIEALNVEQDWNWTRSYYNDAAQEKLARLRAETPKEAIEQGERDWAALIAEVEQAAAQGVDPAGTQAQALAKRWRDLVGRFTKGDPDIAEGLKNLWSDPAHWPDGFKRPYSDAADAFIRKAMGCL